MLRSASLSMWLLLLGAGLWFGYAPAVELTYGEQLLPLVLLSLGGAILLATIFASRLYSPIAGWAKLLAVSAIVSIFAVSAVAYATDFFECSYSCLGFVNIALGYACGEWSRGCVAEWYSVFFVGVSVALYKYSRLSPNLSVNRTCRKRQSGYLQR